MRLFRDENILKEIINKKFEINADEIESIASKEGLILKDNETIFKCLTIFSEQTQMIRIILNKKEEISSQLIHLHRDFINTNQYILHQFLKLKALSESIKKNKPKRIISFTWK